MDLLQSGWIRLPAILKGKPLLNDHNKDLIMFKTILSLIFILLFMNSTAFADERKFITVWHAGTGSNLYSSPQTYVNFSKFGDEMMVKDIRLDDLETDVHQGVRYYIGNWVGGSGSNMITSPILLADFNALRQEYNAKGMRLIDFERFDVNGIDKYTGVWRNGNEEEILTAYLNEADFIAQGIKLTRKNLRLIDVETKIVNTIIMYKGLFRTGIGSNLFTTPRLLVNFEITRDAMLAQGLQLDDLEIIEINGILQYIGVWKSGAGESIITPPLTDDELKEFGKNFTTQGYRLADIENFFTSVPSRERGGSGRGANANPEEIPNIPSYIQFSSANRVVIDFGTIVDGQPRITLPESLLSTLPWFNEQVIFPDAFCGLKIIHAGSFNWQNDQGQIVLGLPYNRVFNVLAEGGSTAYYGGIDFTGPIGACENSSDNWVFPHPLTSSGENPLPDMKLIIELNASGRVEFLNYAISNPEGLDLFEAYSDDMHELIENLLTTFQGPCDLEQKVLEACDASPTSCPVSASYLPSC